MKLFMAVLAINLYAGFVHAEINAKVATDVKVKSVECVEPSHIDHDTSSAGSVTLQKDSGEILKMKIIISRFTDVAKEANLLCTKLNENMVSGKATDVIYEEIQDTKDLRILGITHLAGANRLNEG